MIILLVIEACQIGFSSAALWRTWRQWALAKRRQLSYQRSRLNGSIGRVNRIRCDRERYRLWIHVILLVGCLVIFCGRLNALYQHTVLWAAGTRDLQILVVTILVWRQTEKDVSDRREVQDMVDEEDRRAEALRLSTLHTAEVVAQVTELAAEKAEQSASQKAEALGEQIASVHRVASAAGTSANAAVKLASHANEKLNQLLHKDEKE